MRKTTNNWKFIFCCGMCVLFLGTTQSACSDKDSQLEEPPSTSTEGNITFDSGTDFFPEFSSEGGELTLRFTASISWEVTVTNSLSDNWITISPTKGEAGEAVVTLRVEANQTAEERTAILHFSCGTYEKSIEITQRSQEDAEDSENPEDPENPEEPENPEDEILSLSTKEIHADIWGGIYDLRLEHNQEFEYYPLASYTWIKEVVSRTVSTQTISFQVAANNTYETRQATYVFRSQTGTLSDTLTISQDCQRTLSVSPQQINLSAEGQDFMIEVTGNVAYSVVRYEDWMTLSAQPAPTMDYGLFREQLIFHGAVNNTASQRKGQIVIQSNDGTFQQIVEVIQAGKNPELGGNIEDFEENESEW